MHVNASNAVFYSYRTPFGRITFQADGTGIMKLVFGEAPLSGQNIAVAVTNEAATQVNEYLAGKRTVFSVPLSLNGTEFQQTVWTAALKIPYGHTMSPSDIAEMIGSPRSYRAVGRAASENPLPILIPTHRIVSAREETISSDEGSARLRSRFRELERRFSRLFNSD